MDGAGDAAPRAPRGAAVWSSVFVPAAAVSVLELAATTLTATGVDRPYAARAAALVALVVMAVGSVAGLALAGSPIRLIRSPRAAASTAAALTVFLSTLFVLANGLPGLTSERFEPAPAFGLSAGAALCAALVRRAIPVSFTGVLAPWLEPPLLAGALAGVYTLLRRLRVPLDSVRGLALWAGVVVLFIAGAVTARFLTRRLPRLARGNGFPLPAALAIGAGIYPLAALAALAAGRSPFTAIPAKSTDRPDVLLVVMDTTRADAAPAPSDARFPTPSVRRLARDGTRFTSAFSTSCWTLPAHGSLFTGLAPSEHGATWASEHLSTDVATLAERFRRAGWRTAAFSANPWITPEFGFGRGFDRFAVGNADLRPLRPWLLALGVPGPWSAAAPLFEDAAGLTLASEAMRFLGAHDDPRPAFVFLNMLEPHLPYDPPRAALGSLAGSGWDRRALDAIDQDRIRDLAPGAARAPREIEGLRLLYAAEVSYDDALVGRIVAGLESAGRLDGTVIALTADHGENLGDHPPLDHQLGLWDSLLRVPLILRYPPRVKPGVVDDDLVSLVDVPGALLALAGAPDAGAGGPLLGEGRRDAVFFEYDRSEHLLGLIRDRLKIDPAPWDHDLAGIRTRGAKWIEATDGRHEAYDLAADSGERLNLAPAAGAATPPEWAALSARLREATAARTKRPVSVKAPAISDEAAEKLRSLGYVR